MDELEQLYEAFSYNGLRWNTVNTVYFDRFFDIDLSKLPEGARDVEVDYGEYETYIKKDVYPLWNIRKTVFKSNEFLSPSRDGLYFEHEIALKEDGAVSLRLIQADEGIVGVRREDKKIIVKSYSKEAFDVEGYYIFNIRKTGEELPVDLISNKREYGFLGRYANECRVVVHTKAQIHKQIEELNISEYVILKYCNRIDIQEKTEVTKDNIIEADMNRFLRGDLLPLDERPTIVLGFVRNSESNLCEAMVRYAISQMQMEFDEYRCVGIIESSYQP